MPWYMVEQEHTSICVCLELIFFIDLVCKSDLVIYAQTMHTIRVLYGVVCIGSWNDLDSTREKNQFI